MNRGKQVKKGIWYIEGKYRKRRTKRKQKGAFPFGLIASLAAPVLGEVAKP